jgi:ring-1,2-phenylacetyl-CoA epoxidase subunit PaaC
MSDTDAWPEEAADFVQAITDTKLLLSMRYAEWMLSGPALEDDIAGANAAQDELGHIRQLFQLLQDQGRDSEWLEGKRSPEEFANVQTLDAGAEDWINHVVQVATADWAAWLLLDAITHDDFSVVQKIGEDEYFHLEHHDGRLESLADTDPDALQSALEAILPEVLAFIGPPEYDADTDPLVQDGFTDRSVAELRDAFMARYEKLLDGTDVSLAAIDSDYPPREEWNAKRRRTTEGGIDSEVIDVLQGMENKEFAMA